MKYRREYDKKVIGVNLRRCRLKKNLTVEQVKEYLRIGSLQAIYKWEEGKGYPQTDTMFALMELYGIELKDLLYMEEANAGTNVKIVDDVISVQSYHVKEGISFEVETAKRRTDIVEKYAEILYNFIVNQRGLVSSNCMHVGNN